MTPLLEAHGVAKAYGATVAVDGVDLAGTPGEVVTLLGPNGAGKTTLIELMTGLRTPDRGTVALDGVPCADRAARRRMGLTPQRLDFPRYLKVREILELVAAHYPAPTPLATVAEALMLADLLDRRAVSLSGGQARRVALAAAFVGAPDVVFLDEPTVGLDLAARGRCWEAVRAAAEAGALVVMTTHDLDEAAALSTRVAVIDRGRIVLSETPDGIRRRLGRTHVRFKADADTPPLDGARRENGFWVSDVADGDAAVRQLVETGVPFTELEVGLASLEDALRAVLGDDRR